MNLKVFLYGLIAILLLSLILGYFILVQTAWSLEGKVIDYNGEPVPHATVIFTNYKGCFKTTTDEQGYYAFHNNMLKSLEEEGYRVIVKKKIDGEDFVGYKGDYKVEKKNTKFDIYFKNKDAVDIHRNILETMKIKFDELRPVRPPTEPEPVKMKYEPKPEPVKDIVDLRDLGDYYILLREDKEREIAVRIDLMHGDKVVEEGVIILNCSLFKGWTRPEGHHEELLNSIGLDEVKNTLTKDDGIIKIWTKYTWTEAGDRFSDVIISPLNVFNQRVGKNKAFFSFTDGFGYKFTHVRPKPEEAGAADPFAPGLPEGVEVDLSGLGEYTIRIERKGVDRVCINLMRGDELVEKAMCINDTDFWITKGEEIDDLYRPRGIFPKLKNTIGIVGVGRLINKDTVELSKDDGIVYIRVGRGCEYCEDPTITSKAAFDRNFVIVSREHRADKDIIWYKERWLLRARD